MYSYILQHRYFLRLDRVAVPCGACDEANTYSYTPSDEFQSRFPRRRQRVANAERSSIQWENLDAVRTCHVCTAYVPKTIVFVMFVCAPPRFSEKTSPGIHPRGVLSYHTCETVPGASLGLKAREVYMYIYLYIIIPLAI